MIAKISNKKVLEEHDRQENGIVRFDMLLPKTRQTIRYKREEEEWEERQK